MERDFAYASAIDVLQHLTLAATFTATSTPNATQVYRELGDVSNELDAALARGGYSSPVPTGATYASNLMNSYAAIGAAMYIAAGHPAGQQSPQLAFLERRWNAIIMGLEGGVIEIPGLPIDTTTTLARHPAAATGASAYFTRSMEPVGV